jgi:hypothetical protein
MMLLRGGLGRVLLHRHLHLTLPHTTYVAYVACLIPVKGQALRTRRHRALSSIPSIPPPTDEQVGRGLSQTNKRDPWPSGCARDEQVGWGLS